MQNYSKSNTLTPEEYAAHKAKTISVTIEKEGEQPIQINCAIAIGAFLNADAKDDMRLFGFADQPMEAVLAAIDSLMEAVVEMIPETSIAGQIAVSAILSNASDMAMKRANEHVSKMDDPSTVLSGLLSALNGKIRSVTFASSPEDLAESLS